MSEPTSNETALHEAAHCVAALRHEIGVLHVSVDGEVVLVPPGDLLEQGRHHGAVALGYAVVALAGQAAAPNTEMSKSDQRLLEHSVFLGSWADDPDEIRRAISAIAAHFVRDHREVIEKLAFALVHRRSMAGHEVAQVVGGWGPD